MMSHDLPVSELIQNYPASGIRKMFNIAAQYDDLVNLTLLLPFQFHFSFLFLSVTVIFENK